MSDEPDYLIGRAFCEAEGAPSVREEMKNHFRVPAWFDGKMGWQGMTFFTSAGVWYAMLDDGRSWSDASLPALIEIVREADPSCWRL